MLKKLGFILSQIIWMMKSGVGDGLDYLMDDIDFNSTRDTKYPYCIFSGNKSHHQNHKQQISIYSTYKKKANMKFKFYFNKIFVLLQ